MSVTDEERAELERLGKWAEQHKADTEQVLADNPGMNPITASIVAQDRAQGERAFANVKDGTWDVERALALTGSFARLDLADRLYSEGFLTLAKYHRMLPELWRGSDPDDTDPRWLRLWRTAWARHGAKVIRDGRALPKRRPLIVYRGQREDAPLGIAWTTDPKIAQKFATGAGERVPIEGGVIWRAHVNPDMVMAYLTKRGESEVIVDPAHLIPIDDE